MEMSTTDIVRTAAMLVAFAVAVSRGRKIWMMADAGAVLLFGLGWMVAPGILLEQMTKGPLDELHMFISRSYGAALVGSVVTGYMTRNSGDVTVSNVLLYSRVMGITMQLLAVAYCQMNYRDLEKGGWTQEQIWYGVFGGGVWLLGNLYHSARSDQFGCFGQRNDRVSFVLRLDGFMCLLISLFEFAFPDMWLSMLGMKPIDGIHLHMLRCFIAVMFMSALVSTWAPVFLKDEDKRNVLLGRMVQNGLMVAVFLYHTPTYHSPLLIATNAFIVMATGMAAWGYRAPSGKKTA